MRFLRALPLVLVLLPVSGCRNPFNPSATVRFDRFFAGLTYGYVLSIEQSSASNLISGAASFTSVETIATRAQFSNSSTVQAMITGYTVVYRQVATGLPIPDCGGAAGRRFNTRFIIPALSDNTSPSTSIILKVQIVTSELITFISNELSTTSGGIDCEVTFYGEDDNGYDVKLEAVLHIDVF